MDFFAQQDAARKKSAWLTAVALAFAFVVAVATGFVFEIAAWFVYDVLEDRPILFSDFVHRFPYVCAASFAAAVIVVVVSGIFFYLRIGSGEAIMKSVDARKAKPKDERLLLNVVEEMSIAAGADVPTVWVLDDDTGVNAFAAGTGDGDCALCVTAGALKHLTRDELQGVVAHEFGHIVNGDMRLNTHLAALVAGLGGVAAIGKGMLYPIRCFFEGIFDNDRDRPSGYFRWGRGRLGGGGRGGGGLSFGPHVLLLILVYLLTGSALWLVGLVGVFFAGLLRLAVSREREFLADAAAVQFTRNPEGLADALRFSRLLSNCQWRRRKADSANVCHMFFIGEKWTPSGTHPPVEDRIRRLSKLPVNASDKRFTKRLKEIRAVRDKAVAEAHERYSRRQSIQRAFAPQSIVIPPALNARLRNPGEAGDVLCALLRGDSIPEWKGAMSAAAKRLVANRAVACMQMWGTPEQTLECLSRIDAIVHGKGELVSFEFFVWCAARRRLSRRPAGSFRRADSLVGEAASVIATVTSFGDNPAAAYEVARARLALVFRHFPGSAVPFDSARKFADAIDALRGLVGPAKLELVAALRDVIAQDGRVTDEESDYLAAIADAIGAGGCSGLPYSD